LCQSCDKLVALSGVKGGRRARGKNEVAIEVNNQSVGRSCEKRAALDGDTQDVRARLLDQLLGVSGVDDRDVETTPLVNSYAVSYGLGSHGEHGRVVTDENDATGRRDSRFDDTDNVGNRQAVEEGPHGEVLESGRRGWKLVAKRVVLHVDAHQIVEARSREAENSGNLLGVEQVGGLIPVNPHASQIISKEVVERVTGKERQAVRDPVGLIGVVVVVALGSLTEVANCLGPLLVSARPNAQGNTVESVGRILLKNKSMVNTVRLASASANLNIMGEAGLYCFRHWSAK
jgi:hypothetical protein